MTPSGGRHVPRNFLVWLRNSNHENRIGPRMSIEDMRIGYNGHLEPQFLENSLVLSEGHAIMHGE